MPSASTSPAPSTTTRRSASRRHSARRRAARLELRIIFEEILRRMPDIAQAAGPGASVELANSLTSLPVGLAQLAPDVETNETHVRPAAEVASGRGRLGSGALRPRRD